MLFRVGCVVGNVVCMVELVWWWFGETRNELRQVYSVVKCFDAWNVFNQEDFGPGCEDKVDCRLVQLASRIIEPLL